MKFSIPYNPYEEIQAEISIDAGKEYTQGLLLNKTTMNFTNTGFRES